MRKMSGAYVMDFKVRVTGKDGKEVAVRPYLFPRMDFNGNIDGFAVRLERHKLPAMNPRQKIYYREKCRELDKELCDLIPDNDGYFDMSISSLPTCEELNTALHESVGER